MSSPKKSQPLAGCQAFTLVEALFGVLIIGIIIALVLPNYQGIINKSQEAVCISHMRSIHTALGNYLQDHQDIWPQGPYPKDQTAWEDFWFATLKPYDITENTWQCPSLKKALGNQPGYRIHYSPSMFDATPGIARRWSTQPWLIERFGVHGQGPLICFPDGSIKSMARVLAELGN